jgi:hypothetical protein
MTAAGANPNANSAGFAKSPGRGGSMEIASPSGRKFSGYPKFHKFTQFSKDLNVLGHFNENFSGRSADEGRRGH